MKKHSKLTALILAALIVFTLAACTATPSAPTTETPSTTPPTTSAPTTPTPTETPSETPADAYQNTQSADGSVVYMTTDISSAGLMAIYKQLSFEATGKVAIKMSTGEPPNSNYLRPELIKELVQSLNGTIVESNTMYNGQRSSTALHRQVAIDHGFTAIAEVDILDADGQTSLPIIDGKNLKENIVGSHFGNYDSYVVLSHFKGHQIAGLGGAIKNISIGIASPAGKGLIHSGGATGGGGGFGGSPDPFQESMAEAGVSIVEALDGKIVYINVMNRLSIDCDCNGNPAEPDMHDVGILASFDPVALDKACVDLVVADPNGASLLARIKRQNGILSMVHGEAIGLGKMSYNLVSIDN